MRKKKRKCLYKLGILSEIFFENIRVLVPLSESLDPEENEYLLSENLFELYSSEFTDVLEDGSLLTDEDIFLRILGDEKHHESFNHPLFFRKFLDTHEHVIREFFIEREEELLTNHLTDARLHVLIGIIILIIEKWSGWERFFDRREELLESIFITRRYTDSIFSNFSRMLEIGFGIYEDDGFLDSLENLTNFFLLLPTLSRYIDESNDDIRILERRLGLGIDDDIETISRLMDTRRIEEYHLRILIIVDSADCLLSRLRLGRNGTHFLVYEGINEGRLPGIGSSNKSHISDLFMDGWFLDKVVDIEGGWHRNMVRN